MRQQAVSEEPSPWGQMAVAAAYDMSRKAGYKSADEKQVEKASQVVADAEAAVSETDPIQRQYEVLTRAAKRFNELGMIDYVQQIAPKLTALHRERLENAKLTSEADENVAQTKKTDLENAITAVLAPATIAKGQADARAAGSNYAAWYNVNTNTTRPVNEKDPTSTEKAAADGFVPLSTYGIQAATGADLGGKTNAQVGQQLVDFETAATASALAANNIKDVLQLLQSNAPAATYVGKLTTFADKMAQNAKAVFRANKVDIETTVEGSSVSAEVAKSMPRASAQIQGMVTNFIYAQARVNDPGGRLSNQDIQVLVSQFDPSNPQVLADTLNRMLHQNWKGTQTRARGLGLLDANGAVVTPNSAYDGAREAYEDAVTGTAPVGVADPSKMSDEELLRRLTNGQ